MKSKKLLSILLAVLFIFSSCFIGVSATDNSSEINEKVIMSTTLLSDEHATWTLEAIKTNVYSLKNKATGLYLTIDDAATTLFQTTKRSDASQHFYFGSYNGYRYMFSGLTWNVIYSNTAGDGILIGPNNNSWSNPPTGASGNNLCQFQATIAAGNEIKIKMAGNGAYLQAELVEDVIMSTTLLSAKHATWTLEAIKTNVYSLKNKATGLYLTIDDTATTLFQTTKRSDASQHFYFGSYNGYRYMFSGLTWNVIYSNTAGDGILIGPNNNSWSNPPTGASGNNLCQFQATIAAGNEIMIKMAGNGAYLQSAVADEEEKTGEMVVSDGILSRKQATWVLEELTAENPEATDTNYTARIKNVASDLYITMEEVGGNYFFYQASDRGEGDESQTFTFKYHAYEENKYTYRFIHKATNRIIYLNSAKDGVAFGDADYPDTIPSGATGNSVQHGKVVFMVGNKYIMPSENANVAIRSFYGGKYFQSAVEPESSDGSNDTGAVVFSTSKLSDKQATWILEAVIGDSAYLLKNKATGLYLTMDSTTTTLFQTTERSATDTSQQFYFGNYGGYHYMYSGATWTVIYSNDAGDGILVGPNNQNWSNPPEGASGNNLCQFQATIADGEEIEIKMARNGAYLQSAISLEKVTVTASADAEAKGTVSGNTGEVVVGTSITLNATANAGYVFEGWYNGEEKVSADAVYNFTASEDIALTAKFVEYGDANSDNVIDASDLSAIRTALLNGGKDYASYVEQMNANGDDAFNICDLVAVALKISTAA